MEAPPPPAAVAAAGSLLAGFADFAAGGGGGSVLSRSDSGSSLNIFDDGLSASDDDGSKPASEPDEWWSSALPPLPTLTGAYEEPYCGETPAVRTFLYTDREGWQTDAIELPHSPREPPEEAAAAGERRQPQASPKRQTKAATSTPKPRAKPRARKWARPPAEDAAPAPRSRSGSGSSTSSSGSCGSSSAGESNTCPFCDETGQKTLQRYHKKYGYKEESPPYCYKCHDNFRKHCIKQVRLNICSRAAPCYNCKALLQHIEGYSDSPQLFWQHVESEKKEPRAQRGASARPASRRASLPAEPRGGGAGAAGAAQRKGGREPAREVLLTQSRRPKQAPRRKTARSEATVAAQRGHGAGNDRLNALLGSQQQPPQHDEAQMYEMGVRHLEMVQQRAANEGAMRRRLNDKPE